MKIANADIYFYRLPFVEPMVLLGQEMAFRQGYILKLESTSGAVGFGEMAPFPGLSQESPEKALPQLRQALQVLRNTAVDLDLPTISFLLPHYFPSVLFAVESAVLDVLANEQHISISKFLKTKAAENITIQALAVGDHDEILKQAQAAIAAGFRCLKIKLGRTSLDEDIELVRSLRQNVGKTVRLRLDANRAWTFAQAKQFCRAVSDCHIEYIEEPLQQSDQLADLFKETSVNMALDESLTWQSALNAPPGISAFILKPGIHGGVARTIQFIQLAQSQNKSPVLSCPFYSAFGLTVLAHLAAAFVKPRQPMGLNTFARFKQDLLHQPIQPKGDTLNIAELQNNRDPNSPLLESVE